ncbi:MAG: radical SAM family heme chaperone HemW [Acidimicrobiia bacterium]
MSDRSPRQAPDDALLADAAASWRSAYVHLPYCRRRCPYCDFAVVAGGEAGSGTERAYVESVITEIGLEERWAPLHAVNFGGGTPSLIPSEDLVAILGALEHRFGFEAGVEVSIEANPEDWTPGLGEELVAAGCNRISFGVQSFDAGVLEWLGRAHTPDAAVRAVAGAGTAGFASVGLDLIYGSPGETMRSWRRTVEQALGLEPHHVSAYALTVELGTELSRAVRAGAPGPDPDDQADRYEHIVEAAGERGLVRYEVSNWAVPGHHVRYNLSTWAQGEYLAFGLSANDHRTGRRSRNVRRLNRYLELVASGQRPRAGFEELDAWGAEQERVLLGLRRAAGVAPGAAGRALLSDPGGIRLLEAGVISVREGRLVVNRPLLTDAVARSVLSLSP